MNKYFFFLVVAAASMTVFSSCETDVDLTAPYASTTVVFGLLDPQADTQFVKVNKTFLGDGNLNEYAMIRDSSEYKWEEFTSLRVEEYATGNPDPAATHYLQPITISNKDVNGMFYGPEQTVYYFPTPAGGLNTNRKYKLVADFASRPDVFAWTNVIPSTTIQFNTPPSPVPGTNPSSGIALAIGSEIGSPINYNQSAYIQWGPQDLLNAEIYDIVLRFHYIEKTYADDEWTQEVSSENKFIDWKLGTFNAEDLTKFGTSSYKVTFNGESFFSYLGNSLQANLRVRRIVGEYLDGKTRAFEIRLGLANDELKTWINVNNPVTGIIQERPNYTNIVGGLGLFASRASAIMTNIPLESGNFKGNINALIYGNYTSDLNFCDPNPNNGQYSCN